jgi:hypothetical protein
MRDNTMMVKSMAKGRYILEMGPYTMENSKTMKSVGMEIINGLTGRNMMVHGAKTKCMEQVI